MNWKFWKKVKTYEDWARKEYLTEERTKAFAEFMRRYFPRDVEKVVCKYNPTIQIIAQWWRYGREWLYAGEEAKVILRRMKKEGYAVNTRVSLSIKELKI